MIKTLLLHSSREGQTEKILSFIEDRLTDHQCQKVNLHHIDDIDLLQYDKIVIGASIHYGHLNKKLYQFIDRYKQQLQESKVAFYCVNLTARKEEQKKDTPQKSAYVQTFLKKSPWEPTLIGVFAGALYYPRYTWFDRVMIRFIMSITGGETDTSKEVEYTNWNKVALFADKVATM